MNDSNLYSNSSTSPSLIRRVQARDQDAWTQLTQLYGPLIYHWCKKLNLDGEDAADLFQEVFVSVANAIGRFEPMSNPSHGNTNKRSSFRGWLWTITRNKARDHYRRRQGKALAAGGTTAQIRFSEMADPLDDESVRSEEASEMTRLLHRAMAMIKADFENRTWTAFWRSAVELQPTADIAEDLKMSPASIRQAKSRVLRRLRQILGDI